MPEWAVWRRWMPSVGWQKTTDLEPFNGIIWRILARENAHLPLAPARAPEGRFHHDGQIAIYTSLTAKGAGTAIQRYLVDDTRPRVIVPLLVEAYTILDLRGRDGDIQATTLVWQNDRAQGRRAPTWDVSDMARKNGAQGILYRSRTHPELSHLVLFGVPDPGFLTCDTTPTNWP